MEFGFPLQPLFDEPIIKITQELLPANYARGVDDIKDTQVKFGRIIDRLGMLSSKAQKLNEPVTSADRYRHATQQGIYLIANVEIGHHGVVLGMLKIGTKDLYLCDEAGETHRVPNTACILDFYIHESHRNSDVGKHLFDFMLKTENWSAIKCAIDRPSDKILPFFKKYYNLRNVIPQTIKYIIFEGFFDDNEHTIPSGMTEYGKHVTVGPRPALNPEPKERFYNSRYGRRPTTCKMAQLIRNGPQMEK